MGRGPSPSPARRLLPALLVALLVVALPSAAAAAAEVTAAEDEPTTVATDTDRVSELTLTVTPVVGDGPDDGDLAAASGTGLPLLVFSPDAPAEQTAVYEYVVTNTGEVTLDGVAVTDERIGTVLAASDETSLAPGESTTVRAAATFTFDQAVAGLAGLVVTTAAASATDTGGGTVTDDAEAAIEIVAVLPTATAVVDLAVVTGAGDVAEGPGGMPTVTWTAEDAESDAVRTVHFRLMVTNDGDTPLHGVTVAIDVLGERIPALGPDVVLAPGDDVTVDVVHELAPSDVVVEDVDGPSERSVTAHAELEATDESGTQTTTARDDATLLAVVVAPEVLQVSLPAAGLDDPGAIIFVALLHLLVGTLTLRLSPPVRSRSPALL